MKTEATLPFAAVIKDGQKYHEPLAHHDGIPLAMIAHDASNRLFFGMAVRVEGWEWPVCLVPINQEEAAKLEEPDPDWPTNTAKLFIELMGRCDGYYLWELLGDRPEGNDRQEFVAGPVPRDYMPDL